MNLKNKYYVVRHGECDFNVAHIGDHHGHPDNHLTVKGREQIKVSAFNLKEKGIVFEKIISSPFPRTNESAEIFLELCDVKDVEILKTSLLQEMNHGSVTKDTSKTIVPRKELPTAYEEMHAPHGNGECFWDVRGRMSALLEQLESAYEGKNLLLITHGTPVWMFYSIAMGLDEEETLAFKHGRKEVSGFFINNAEVITVP